MALHEICALRLSLDAFSDDPQAKAQSHRDHRVNDRRADILGDDRTHE
jgi:hypothetical protein